MIFENKEFNVVEFDFKNIEYYVFTFLFVVGNFLLPLAFHQFNLGGNVFLPIYFFILIGSYKFGFKVGLSIALLTPFVNHLMTGMPNLIMLAPVFVKGMALAFFASFLAKKIKTINLLNILSVLVLYQLTGVVFESIYFFDIIRALNNFLIAYPGLIIQLVFGYFVLRGLNKYGTKNNAADN